jgi:hypothetical protein
LIIDKPPLQIFGVFFQTQNVTFVVSFENSTGMNNTFAKTRYRLQSVKTGKLFDDSGWTLDAPEEKEPTLIRAI